MQTKGGGDAGVGGDPGGCGEGGIGGGLGDGGGLDGDMIGETGRAGGTRGGGGGGLDEAALSIEDGACRCAGECSAGRCCSVGRNAESRISVASVFAKIGERSRMTATIRIDAERRPVHTWHLPFSVVNVTTLIKSGSSSSSAATGCHLDGLGTRCNPSGACSFRMRSLLPIFPLRSVGIHRKLNKGRRYAGSERF